MDTVKKMPAIEVNGRDNVLRALRFQGPSAIPISYHISHACWQNYDPAALEDIMLSHPLLFPGYIPGSFDPSKIKFGPEETAGKPHTDPWGCVWETCEDGITGTISHHPLADWSALDTYEPPDPEHFTQIGTIDWKKVETSLTAARAKGHLTRGGVYHGHLFLRLTYIRGFENMIFDMVDDHPHLPRLIDMIEQHSAYIVKKYLDIGVDIMGFPEDMGSQTGPLISPALFKKYIVPTYKRLMAPVKAAGTLIHMHTDGHIMDLMDDLIESGVDIINLQDLVNGIDRIEKELKGRIAIDLDIDRQNITRFGTPQEVDDLVREEVMKLGSKEGGLSMIWGWYPGIPLENARAVADAMEKYATYYA
jgi:hypothetical protein